MNKMDQNLRDSNRLAFLKKLIGDREKLIADGQISRSDSYLCDMDTEFRMGKELKDKVSATDISHEESIVLGILTLVKSSDLPYQVVMYAVRACLEQGNNDDRICTFPPS